LRPDNHNGRYGIGPSPGRNKGQKTGSRQVVILTTLFRSVASRARTPRHLSAPESRSRQDHAHLDYRNVQQRTQGRSSSGPTSRDECRDLACHWDGAQIATHCLACRDIASRTLSRAVATTQRSSGSSNAKGICHCNRRCAFLFLAPQGSGSVHQSEGSPIISQLQSVAFRKNGNQKTREKWTQPNRGYRPLPPAPKHQNIVLHLALRSSFYWSRVTATETVASPPKTMLART
jgi:hypothetical protein